MSDQKYTHALALLTVNGEEYKGTAELTRPMTIIPENEYEAAKRDLELLKPTSWIIVSPEFEVGNSEVLNASLKFGAQLENGKEVYHSGVPVQVIKA